MYMADAVVMLLEYFNRILAGEGQMTGIINQADILRISHLHQAVDLPRLLYGGRHVVMINDLHAAVISDLAQMIEALGENLPLIIVQNLLVRQRGVPLMLNREALVRDIDDLSTDSLQEIHVVDKRAFIPPHRLLVEIRADPCRDSRDAAAAEFLVQDCRISRILAADFCADITAQCDFTDGLEKAVLRAHLRHVILCPCNRSNSNFYFLRVQHIQNTFLSSSVCFVSLL